MQLRRLVLSSLVVLPAVLAAEPSLTDTLAKFPQCAVDCLAESVLQSSCSLTNQTCMCQETKLQNVMTTCVIANCTIKEGIFVKNLTSTACGYPIRDRSREYIAISNAFGIVSAIFVIQRFAYKFWAKMDYGADDWFTLATIVNGVPVTVINTYGIGHSGIGRDAWTLTGSQLTDFGRFFYVMEIIYFSEVSLIKLALLFFYIRIFPTEGVRRTLWATVAFVAIYGLCFTFVAIFQCTPIKFYWLKWDGLHQGRCLDINAIAWSNAAISIALDGWMLAIPLWQLRTLNLDWRKKVGVGLMFGVGTFVTIVSILRLRSLVKFGAESMNPTWDFFDVGMWSTVEINVGLICACLPSLRLLLVRLFPRLMDTSQRYYAKYASAAMRSTARRASRPLGNTVVSQVERSEYRPEPPPKQITCHKTFTVEYNDNDEAQLVYSKDIEMKSARSGSEGSFTS